MLAAISQGHTDLADLLFLLAFIAFVMLSIVAIVVVPSRARIIDFLLGVGLGLVSLALFVL